MAGQAPNDRHDGPRAQRTASAAGERRESDGDDWDAEQQDDNIVPLTRTEAERLFVRT